MISFSDVSFSYGRETKGALAHFNFDVCRGECVLLCGKSGCGKSTVLNLINGIIPHHISGELYGEVLVNGVKTTDISVQALSKTVGSVFQNPKSQFFHLNTTDELLFSCSNQGMERQEMKRRLFETTALFGMEKLTGRDIFGLSGGEKQKIACASVYAGNPQVFVFDEPSANLDHVAIDDLSKILRKIKAEGHTIMIAEHRLSYLMDICDRVLYIDDGRLSQEYTIDAFRQLDENARKRMGLRSLLPVDIAFDKRCPDISACSLKLANLLYRYKDRAALDIPEYTFDKGGVVAVVGENGAGKTTLANCLCGINRSNGIFIDGKKQSERRRCRQFGIVMQDVNHQLFTETVLDEMLLNSDRSDEKVISDATSLLEKLDLVDYADRHPLSLSGGQKQRLVIGVSIYERKDYIVFDEPTSGLDYTHMEAIAQQIRELSRMTKLILIITHDYELINLCCDAVIYMKDGMIKDAGNVYMHEDISTKMLSQ